MIEMLPMRLPKFTGRLFVERVCHGACQETRIKMKKDGRVRNEIEVDYKSKNRVLLYFFS